MTDTDLIKKKLSLLRTNYFRELPAKLTEIHRLWDNILTGDTDSCRELERLFHKIAGSAGMYGADDLTNSAREIENFLNDKQCNLNTSDIAQITSYLNKLETLVCHLTQ